MKNSDLKFLCDRVHAGVLTAEHMVEMISKEVSSKVDVDPVDYITNNLWYDQLSNNLFRKKDNVVVKGNLVHVGTNNSPMARNRVIWFLQKGDFPHKVKVDELGRIYALYEKGGSEKSERFYLGGFPANLFPGGTEEQNPNVG